MRCIPLLVLPLLVSCQTLLTPIINREVRKHADGINAAGVDVFVRMPEVLRNVRSIALAEFKVHHITSMDDRHETLFADSPLKGKVGYASARAGPLFLEVFESRLLRSSELRVVERNRLQHILQERQMEMSGMVEERKDASINVMGADALLFGTVSNTYGFIPDSLYVDPHVLYNVRVVLVDVKSGAIMMTTRDRLMVVGPFLDDEKIIEQIADDFARAFAEARTKAAAQEQPFGFMFAVR